MKEKTLENIGIVSGVQVFTIGIRTVTSIILVRLLLPSDFGIVAIAYLVLTTMGLFKDFGLGAAIIQKKEDVEDALATAFTTRLIISCILFLITLMISPYWSRFFSDPSQSPTTVCLVIKVLSFLLIIESFRFIPATILSKKLKFGINAIPEVCRQIVNSGIAIGLAFYGFSFWSLIYASLAASIVDVIVLNIVAPWKIRLGFDKNVAKGLFQYGKHIVAASTIIFLITNLDDAVVGKIFGLTTLGYYTIAWKWGNWSAINLAYVVSKVMFPTYAKIQDDIPRLREGFLKTLEFVSLLLFPASFGMFAIAPEFVNIILGEKWAPAIIPLQVLCFFGLFNALANTIGQVFLAKGRPDIITKSAVFFLLIMGISLYPAIIYLKLIGASLAILFPNFLIFSWQLLLLCKMIDLRLSDFFEKISVPLISSLIMVAAILISKMFIGSDGIADVFSFLSIGIIFYLIPYFIFTQGAIVSDLKELINIFGKGQTTH